MLFAVRVLFLFGAILAVTNRPHLIPLTTASPQQQLDNEELPAQISEYLNDRDDNDDDDDFTWMRSLNAELLRSNQLTAFYGWQLTVRPTAQLASEATRFNVRKTARTNRRCDEARRRWANELATTGYNYYDTPTANSSMSPSSLARIVRLLCNGPRFTAAETAQVSHGLAAMQSAFVGAALCLPRALNVCTQFDWALLLTHHTYVRHDDGRVRRIGQRPADDNDVNEMQPPIVSDDLRCLRGEPDLDRLMAGDHSALFDDGAIRCALDPFSVARWAWEAWRLAVGPSVWAAYRPTIGAMNAGARRAGFADLGAVWRAELELPRLGDQLAALWRRVRPLYERLHAVLRSALHAKLPRSSEHRFDRRGAIPAHLLGSMWSQDWTPFGRLLRPGSNLSLDARVRRKRWTGRQVAALADDFYASLGLPRMPDAFWRHSVFGGGGNSSSSSSCHGSAANMYRGSDDVRMIVCASPGAATADDVYVTVHEMGHVQYFMGFMAAQPPVFQDANSALQEAVGDAVHLGFVVPQHLYRLGLLGDAELMGGGGGVTGDIGSRRVKKQPEQPFLRAVHGDSLEVRRALAEDEDGEIAEDGGSGGDHSADVTLLLHSALRKVAQLPAEYLLDLYRWRLFADADLLDDTTDVNADLWRLVQRLQGVRPPGDDEERAGLFDAGSKFHVADNTPFARYFLASFVQAQIFRGLCEVTLFGEVRRRRLPMPLYRCDIYGSRRAGKVLKKAFALGNSLPWTEVLFVLTGEREVRADAFLEYFAPLDEWLQQLISDYDIPVGW